MNLIKIYSFLLYMYQFLKIAVYVYCFDFIAINYSLFLFFFLTLRTPYFFTYNLGPTSLELFSPRLSNYSLIDKLSNILRIFVLHELSAALDVPDLSFSSCNNVQLWLTQY